MKFLTLRCYNSILINKVDNFKKKRLWDLFFIYLLEFLVALDLGFAFFFLNCLINLFLFCFGVSNEYCCAG